MELATFPVLLYHRLKGKESGLNPVKYVRLQTINTFIPEKDLAESRAVLRFGNGDILKSFAETLEACRK